jgi:hypothetical protein
MSEEMFEDKVIPLQSFDREDYIKCLSRELGFRKKVYPRWIGLGRTTESRARWEIECMTSILDFIKETMAEDK